MAHQQRLRLGAHMSIAGGLDKAVERAKQARCDVVQIFTKNNNQWAAKPLTDEMVAAWKHALIEHGVGQPIAHASYLINLAAPKQDLWRKSIDATVIEWQRAEQLGLDGLVVHPGAFTDSSQEQGLEKIIQAVRETIDHVQPEHCRLLLENTAGQGSCLGYTMAQLGTILEGVSDNKNVGVCFDTCHALAAGYDLTSDEGYAALTQEIRDVLPADAIRALHVNDSKKPCGSRVDRHEHIGQGFVTLDGFRRVLNDPLFNTRPMYLETPKGDVPDSDEDWDVRNLNVLRSLVSTES